MLLPIGRGTWGDGTLPSLQIQCDTTYQTTSGKASHPGGKAFAWQWRAREGGGGDGWRGERGGRGEGEGRGER